MRKVIFILFCFLCIPFVCYADCTYTDIKNLNVLGSYITHSYNYDEVSGSFVLTLRNVPVDLYAKINNTIYNPENGEIVVSGFGFGERVKVDIMSSNATNCVNEYVRAINVSFPYLNNYYNSSECVGHENLDVCSYRFLNYEISNETFNKLISEDNNNPTTDIKDKEASKKKDKTPFWDVIGDYSLKYGIPVILVIVSSLVTFFICNIIYRRIKHGL